MSSSSSYTFRPPTKAILTQEQLAVFQQSPSHDAVIEYIEALNESVKGAKLTDECEQSEAFLAIYWLEQAKYREYRL